MRPKRSLPAVLALAVAGALALSGGVDASSALAACSNTTPVAGQGSSLQKISQEVWIKEGKCDVTYTASGSAAGLEAFGFKTKTMGSDEYIGTDDAPSGSFSSGQLKEMEEAAGGTSENPQDLVIPVAQAAVAIIVKLPSECLLSQISNSNLEEVWDGTITEWSGIAGVTEMTENACKKTINRVVRQDGSGTTYQFKHYLFEIDSAVQANDGGRTWEELQPETQPNREWPEETTVVRPTPNGGGAEVKLVAESSSAIGYAALADARNGKAKGEAVSWLAVQNVGHTPEYVYPGKSTGEPSATASTSNCEGTVYELEGIAEGADKDWSKIYGGHPTGNEQYSICTLTWDVALVEASEDGFSGAQDVEAREYMKYVVSKANGQTVLAGHDYFPVEAAVGAYAEKEAGLIK